MKAPVLGLIFGVAYLLVGIVCLLMPERIRTFGLNLYARHSRDERLKHHMAWMRTPSYIRSLRLVGVIALMGFVLILFAAFRGG